jgi:hypothetical protein
MFRGLVVALAATFATLLAGLASSGALPEPGPSPSPSPGPSLDLLKNYNTMEVTLGDTLDDGTFNVDPELDVPDPLDPLDPLDTPLPTPLPTPTSLPRKLLATVAPKRLPTPSWVKFGKQRDKARVAHEANKVAVRKAGNAKLDLVLYGDSITAFHHFTPSVWQRHMGRGRLALGMGGSTIPELAWRIMLGGELPKRSPTHIVLHIGINDLKSARMAPATIASQLKDLLRWLRAATPSSQLYVMGLVPNAHVDVGPVNDRYRRVVTEVPGVSYIDCSVGLNAKDKTLFGDGTHPTSFAYDRVILPCLKTAVAARG